MAKREAKYNVDAAKAASEGRYGDVVANAVSIALYKAGVEPASAYMKNLINLLGDIWGVGFEQMIGWTQGPGTYMIRCVAQIRPGAPEAEMRRAATVAVKIVQVMPVEAIAEETLNKGEDDVTAAEQRLADEQKAA